MPRRARDFLLSLILMGIMAITVLILIQIFGLEGVSRPIPVIILLIVAGVSAFLLCFNKLIIAAIIRRINHQNISDNKKENDKIKSFTNPAALKEGKYIVPIDYSEAKKVIPPETDITHSILMNLKDSLNENEYISHILTTPYGIAWGEIDSNNEKLYHFGKWYSTEGIKLGFIGLNIFTKAYLIRDEKNETKNQFTERKYKFFIESVAIAIEGTKEIVQNMSDDITDRQLLIEKNMMLEFIETYSKKLKKVKKKAEKKDISKEI